MIGGTALVLNQVYTHPSPRHLSRETFARNNFGQIAFCQGRIGSIELASFVCRTIASRERFVEQDADQPAAKRSLSLKVRRVARRCYPAILHNVFRAMLGAKHAASDEIK